MPTTCWSVERAGALGPPPKRFQTTAVRSGERAEPTAQSIPSITLAFIIKHTGLTVTNQASNHSLITNHILNSNIYDTILKIYSVSRNNSLNNIFELYSSSISSDRPNFLRVRWWWFIITKCHFGARSYYGVVTFPEIHTLGKCQFLPLNVYISQKLCELNIICIIPGKCVPTFVFTFW